MHVEEVTKLTQSSSRHEAAERRGRQPAAVVGRSSLGSPWIVRDRIEPNSKNEPRRWLRLRLRQRQKQRQRQRRCVGDWNKCVRFKNKSKIMFSLCCCPSLRCPPLHLSRRGMLWLHFPKGKTVCEMLMLGPGGWWAAPAAARTTAQNSSNDPQSVSKTSHTRCKQLGVREYVQYWWKIVNSFNLIIQVLYHKYKHLFSNNFI